MKAIRIRYLPWTETKPARIKLSADGYKSVFILACDFDYGNDVDMALAISGFFRVNKARPWADRFVFGSLPGKDRVAVPLRGSNNWEVLP